MSFLFPLGLLVAVAVVGPLVAHLLRRRRPEERPFPPARLVPTAPPVARRRAHVEDRALLIVRAIAILALALLAASPLARCTRLSLDRRGGASVALAIVIDDSMSMSAELPPAARRSGAKTRFELAMVAARELASSLRPGDATTIVLAGAPARVVLPSTGEAVAVRAALDLIAQDGPSDRATDLEAAIHLASAALGEQPQPDRRVVLLSDLADGDPNGAALSVDAEKRLRLEAPLDALREPPPKGNTDCAVLAATPEGAGDSIRVRVACALHGQPVGARAIEIVTCDAAHTRIGVAAFPPSPPNAPASFDLLIPIDRAKIPIAQPLKPALLARLTEPDAIADDDVAPVLGAAAAPALAVVVGEGGALDEVVATGGASVLERALAALQTGVATRPLPSIPDREIDLAPFAALAIDDPAGLGPESRTAIEKWLEKGGVLLLALGPRAASPSLGSSFAPLLMRPLKWEKVDGPLGVDPAHAGPLGEGAVAPIDLAPKGRAVLDREDVERLAILTAWKGGAPLVATRTIGQGEAWIVTLPFAPDVSDLPIRPSFLALVDTFVGRARDRGAGARLEIGKAWTAGPDDSLEVVRLDDQGRPIEGSALVAERTADARRARPRRAGTYLVSTTPKGGTQQKEIRAVAPVPKEVDLSPRALAKEVASGPGSGLSRATIELGPFVALALVLFSAIELIARGIRLFGASKPAIGDDTEQGTPSVPAPPTNA